MIKYETELKQWKAEKKAYERSYESNCIRQLEDDILRNQMQIAQLKQREEQKTQKLSELKRRKSSKKAGNSP